jgi:hypothetical protein
MVETEAYYRKRLEEELAAAARSEDPSISIIHLEMARRYRDLLDGKFERITTDAERTHSVGGIGANVGAVHA